VAERLFLHVGTPKSGTTFLQGVWWQHRDELLAQGLLLPGRGVFEHYWASCQVRGARPLRHVPGAAADAWDRMLAAVADHRGDALVSHELFSPAAADKVREALRQAGEVAREVHVLLTARDLLRQVPAEWQQRTKHGRTQTYEDFLDMIRTDHDVNFWRVQDVPAVLERWSQGIPPERVHLVVLPPPGGPRSFLWDETSRVLGIDGTGMAERAVRSNESLGLVEVETMRRLAATLAADGLPKPTQRLLKDFVAEQIFRAGDPERIVVPADVHPWAVEQAQRMVAQLEGRAYDVVGDLQHLVPGPEPVPGRPASAVGDDEIATVALRALAQFVRHEDRARRRAGRAGTPQARLGRARRLLGAVVRRVRDRGSGNGARR